MMPTNVPYPKVSLENVTGVVSRWLVRDGDLVQRGQILFEIDNDKAAVEVEAPVAGVVRNLVPVGTEIEVGAQVAQILAVGELSAEARPPLENASLVESRDARAGAATVVPAKSAVAAMTGQGRPRPTPLARRIARDHQIDLTCLQGTGPGGRVQRDDVLAHLSGATGSDERSEVEAGRKRSELLNTVWLRRASGVPLVLLHGFAGDLNNWRGLFAGAVIDAPVLALDLPGHGASPRDVPPDLDGVAELVERTLAESSGGPVVLAGHSFGGAVAARIATRGVVDVRALALFAPAGLGPEIDQAFVDGILRARSEDSLRPWLQKLVHDPHVISDDFVRITAAGRRDDALAAMREFAAVFMPDGTQRFAIRDDLARLDVPCRIVFGRGDKILPFTATRGLPGQVGLHALDGCGHLPHLEHPQLARRILWEMLRLA